MKRYFLLLLLVPFFTYAESLYSPTWGFFVDLPEGYEFTDGDGRDRFSFAGPSDAMFDMVVYNGTYRTINDMVNDVSRRLANVGDVDFFRYNGKQAAIMQLDFAGNGGWAICIELEGGAMLLALAYGPKQNTDLELFHISALDSIAPSIYERYYPGPVIEYSYPRGEDKQVTLAGTGVSVMMKANDAEAAQVLIEREFKILQVYAATPFWQEAWLRYYRFIYRDSIDRVSNAAAAFVSGWGGNTAVTDDAKRAFAQKVLTYVQGFQYQRDLSGSDFLNLVTAVIDGRGDCDSRVMLWAIILAHADIRAAMMVSPQYSHAMGLVDLPGTGARFDYSDKSWLVAETTAKIDIGLIAQDQSNPLYWFGVLFE
jgi:hypothetical protein